MSLDQEIKKAWRKRMPLYRLLLDEEELAYSTHYSHLPPVYVDGPESGPDETEISDTEFPEVLGKKLNESKCFRRADGKLEKYREPLREAICEKFNYCKRQKDYKSELNLALAVGDCLSTFSLNFPVPLASVTVYIVKSKFLDKLCDCSE